MPKGRGYGSSSKSAGSKTTDAMQIYGNSGYGDSPRKTGMKSMGKTGGKPMRKSGRKK